MTFNKSRTSYGMQFKVIKKHYILEIILSFLCLCMKGLSLHIYSVSSYTVFKLLINYTFTSLFCYSHRYLSPETFIIAHNTNLQSYKDAEKQTSKSKTWIFFLHLAHSITHKIQSKRNLTELSTNQLSVTKTSTTDTLSRKNTISTF